MVPNSSLEEHTCGKIAWGIPKKLRKKGKA
jgi:hypothetical protein